jgi:hypothetical protein
MRNVWLYCRLWVGRILGLAGFPGFVRNSEYDTSICKAHVSVRVGPLFTVVSVNGLDVYFHRMTGKIDGVGFTQASDCTVEQTARSEHLA